MGAWDFGLYRFKYPRMGVVKTDPPTRDEVRVNRAVRSFQVRLLDIGFSPGRTDGVFGYRTMRAVKKFQAFAGLTNDGQIGRLTASELLRTPVRIRAHTYDVPKAYLAGIVIHESGWDPAATHLNDATTASPGTTDRGLVQINDGSHPEVTDKETFTAHFSLDWEAKQLSSKHDHYVDGGAGDQLAWDAAIMYNLNPVAANGYATGESTPSDKALKFVEDVKRYGLAYWATAA